MTQRRLDIAIKSVALFGVAVGSYLTFIHFAHLKPLCLSSGGCEVVQSSTYSAFVGIPVALIGLLGYIAIIGSMYIPGENGRFTTACLALVGFGFSVYLTYLELFVIKAICQWCVVSAILMTILAVLTVMRLLHEEVVPPDQDDTIDTESLVDTELDDQPESIPEA